MTSVWQRTSLRTRLVAVILTATLPMALLLWYEACAGIRSQPGRQIGDLARGATALAESTRRELASITEALTTALPAGDERAADLPKLRERLLELKRQHPTWQGVLAQSADGDWQFDSTEPAGRRGALSRLFAEPARIDEPAPPSPSASQLPSPVRLSGWLADEPTASPFTLVAVAWPPHGPTQLIVAARIPVAVWQRVLDASASPSDGDLALVDQQDRILARTRHPAMANGKPVRAAAIADPASGATRAVSLEGDEVLAARQHIGGGWRAESALPTAAIDGAVQRTMLGALGTAAACLLIGLSFALWLGRRLILPLEPRSSASRAEEEGARHRLEAQREAETESSAKDEFLAMLGHELRNPLGAIASAVEVLRRAETGSALGAKAIEILGRQTQTLARILDDLLDVAGVISGKVSLTRERVDLAELVGRVVATARLTDGQAHDIVATLAAVPVDADRARMAQVLHNLLGNALRYSPPAASVEVRVFRDGAEAVVQVQDHGTSIPAPLLNRVFDLYVQGERSLDRRGGGLGLGLTLVRRLMRLHGGSVTASTSEQGSVFEVRLPTAPAAPAEAAAGSESR